MSLPVVLRDEAQAEFDEAFDYYEGNKPGSGVRSAAQVQKTLNRIAANPVLHAPLVGDVRKARVARFPNLVYYRAESARVQVIAVFHTSRDPSEWKGRA